TRPGFRTVFCNPSWIRLGWRSRVGPTSILGKSPLEGMTQILQGQTWTVGSTPVDGDLYTIEEIDGTVLSLLRRWATVTGYELEFDGVTRQVSLVDRIGEDRGIGFFYGHNLATVTRTYAGPEATRLYAIGA